ncbi:MAG: sigma-70 family RNA polymerase sigma factor [Anaerolineae bacterium]|nr:sigma-70 family RNA polymerase sigma factor [Anaerolineae bacterium]
MGAQSTTSHETPATAGYTADTPDLLQFYLRDIRPISSLLTPEEEQTLARELEAGQKAAERLDRKNTSLAPEKRAALEEAVETGEAARLRLFLSNTRLVVSVAKRYQGLGLPLPDLIQEGNLGLMKAIERFDPNRGVRLSTYATWWIRQTISRAAGDVGRTIRLPINQGQRWGRLRRIGERLAQELGREPNLEEIADAADLTLGQVAHTMKAAREPLPIDELVGDEEDRPREDLIADAEGTDPEEMASQTLLAEKVQRLLAKLPPRQEHILKLRFGLVDGETRSMAQIGEMMGYSRERIRQLQHKALDALREMQNQHRLQDYLE